MEYIRVLENKGIDSAKEFGKVGTKVFINRNECYIQGNGTDNYIWNYKSKIIEGKTLKDSLESLLGGTIYATSFSSLGDTSISINEKRYLDYEGRSLFEYLQKNIKIKANPIIVYNGDILEKDNYMNSLIMLNKDDVIEISYNEGDIDISEIFDK